MDIAAIVITFMFSPEGREYTGEIVKVVIVWFMFRKEFRKQFDKLTNAINAQGEAIKHQGETHGQRLERLEDSVFKMNNK